MSLYFLHVYMYVYITKKGKGETKEFIFSNQINKP